MKRLYIIIIVGVFAFSAKGLFAHQGIRLGMELKELSSLLPAGQLKKIYTNQWAFEEELYGLKGKWVYNFKDGKVQWFSYGAYFVEPKDLNRHNFDKCLSAARHLIEDYTKLYGRPNEFKKGRQEFIDPYKKHHWGYDVVSAGWTDGDETISVSFNFQGSKGIYFFVVEIRHRQ